MADRFHSNFEATIDLLSDIRDDIMAQEMPAAETEVVEMQQEELKVGGSGLLWTWWRGGGVGWWWLEGW